jgi:hypothetical protein
LLFILGLNLDLGLLRLTSVINHRRRRGEHNIFDVAIDTAVITVL